MGLRRQHKMPEDIGWIENDPRIISQVAEEKRHFIQRSVDEIVNLVLNRTETGDVTVKVLLEGAEVSGAKIYLYNAVTDEKLETLSANAGQELVFRDLSYRQAYRAEMVYDQKGAIETKQENIVFQIKSEQTELQFTLALKPYVKKYNINSEKKMVIEDLYLDIPLIYQNPELPNGCEPVSITAALQFWGCSLDKFEIADHYLAKENFYWKNGKLYGADPQVAFSGEPRDAMGWFVYEKPIVRAAKDYINKIGKSELAVEAMDHASENELLDELNQGRPVVIWVTQDMKPARFDYSWTLVTTGEVFQAPTNLHCTVLHGYKNDVFYVMDPILGYKEYPRDDFMAAYESLDARAIRIFDEEVQ